MLGTLGLAGCDHPPPAFRNTNLGSSQIFPQGKLLGSGGRPVDFADFRGKLLIVFFGYTSCPDVCPDALRKYASLVRNLHARDAARIQLLFISLDPERDTPDKVDTYAKWFNPGFIGATGDSRQIAEIARQFKVVYRKEPIEGSLAYVIDHTSSAYVVDPHGQLRLVLADNALIEPILSDLQQLLAEK